jgi:Fe-S cluster biogenesis protein NfuA/nitrite reductase/ring-hydroxylating ferredoxin subunit
MSEQLTEQSDQIERLLDEVEAMVGPNAWLRIQELVARVIDYHGRALERLLAIVLEARDGHDGLAEKLCADDLVSSVLLLHGLHPEPTLARIERGLDEVRPYLASHGGGVELLDVDPGGTARLRLLGGCRGCPSSRSTIDQAIRRAIEDAAPEVLRIEVEPAEPGEALIRIGSRSARAGGRSRWVPLADSDEVPIGGLRSLTVEGVGLVLINLGGVLQAYRNACGACAGALDRAALHDASLVCSCGASFDLSSAGTGASGAHLEPVPLLSKDGVPRVALEAA